MRVSCQQCSAVFTVDDTLARVGAIRVKCPSCGHIRVLHPDDADVPSGDRVPVAGSSSMQSRCERCGAVVDGDGSNGLCPRCRDLAQANGLHEDSGREWRVQKENGVILGPLTIDEVKDKFLQREVSATDMLARRDGEFRLISSYPEFATFFRRPGEVFAAEFRHPPDRKVLRSLLLLAGLVVVLVTGLVVWILMQPGKHVSDHLTDAVEDAFVAFAEEVPNPHGTSREALENGWQLMLRDRRIDYLKADRLFKAALLLDPGNSRAYAGWVQNRALLDVGQSNINERKRALDLVDYALKKHPADPVLLRARAYLMFSLGRLPQAKADARRACSKLPDDPECLLILGASQVNTNTDEAAALIEKALQSDERLQLAYRWLAEARSLQGRLRAALNLLQKRMEKEPGQFESLQALARLQEKVGHFDKAQELYELILGGDPTRHETAVALARIMTQIQARPEDAVHLLDASLAIETGGVDGSSKALLLSEKASALLSLNRLADAQNAITQALKLDPMLVEALYLQAVIEQQSGQLSRALSHLSELRAHLGMSANLIARLGVAFAQVPNFDRAVKELSRAVEYEPNEVNLYLLQASLLLELDNLDQSFRWLRRATLIDPFYREDHRSTTAYFDKDFLIEQAEGWVASASKRRMGEPLAQAMAGMVLLRAGKPQQARNRLLLAIQLDEECLPALMYLGLHALLSNNVSQAVRYLERAHRVDSLHAGITRMLARALLADGKASRALQLLVGLLRTDASDLNAQMLQAEALIAKGKSKQGIRILVKVHRRDPENLRVRHQLFESGY